MYPSDYLYTKEHEWLKVDGDTATVGITAHAQNQLGEIVYVESPELNESYNAGDEFGSVESVKAVAELFLPVAGEVLEINETLEDSPELVNNNPHDAGWLVKIKVTQPDQLEELMNAEAYLKFVDEESQ